MNLLLVPTAVALFWIPCAHDGERRIHQPIFMRMYARARANARVHSKHVLHAENIRVDPMPMLLFCMRSCRPGVCTDCMCVYIKHVPIQTEQTNVVHYSFGAMHTGHAFYPPKIHTHRRTHALVERALYAKEKTCCNPQEPHVHEVGTKIWLESSTYILN